MAQKVWRPALDLITAESAVIITSEGATLTKVRSGLGSYWGSYPAAGATLEFNSLVADSITELLGFKEDVVYPIAAQDYPDDGVLEGEELGTVEYQTSFDGGNWQYWTGAAWANAGASDWNSDLEMSVGLTNTSPPDEIKFKARIVPQLGFAPLLNTIALYYELSYNFDEDIFRSLRRWVQSHLAARVYYKEDLLSDTDAVTIVHDLEVVGVIGVYNLTTDPGRSDNLFDSILGNVVTMTSVQSAGDRIEVIFTGKVSKVLISAESESHIAELPAVVVTVSDLSEVKSERSSKPVREYLGDHTELGLRTAPAKKRFDVEVNCLSQYNLTSIAMGNSVSQIFSEEFLAENTLRALASGEKVAVLNLQPVDVRDSPSEKLFRKVVRFTGDVYDWQGTVLEQLHTVEEIVLDAGNFSDFQEQVEVL